MVLGSSPVAVTKSVIDIIIIDLQLADITVKDIDKYHRISQDCTDRWYLKQNIIIKFKKKALQRKSLEKDGSQANWSAGRSMLNSVFDYRESPHLCP